MAASRNIGTLSIDLVARLGGLTSGMDKAEREVKKRSQGIKSALGSLKGALAGIGIAVGISQIVQATIEAEKSLALLDNAVRATGGSAGFTTQQLVDMSAELQSVTTYADDAIQNMQQLLLRFQSIQGVNFERAQQSVLDLATALNLDLAGAAKLVGKALEDPQKGMTQLARSGVVLSEAQKNLVKSFIDTGDKAAAQGVLLDALEGKFRGAAAAARNTLGGALEGLKNSFGDLLEGKGGVSSATDAINGLSDILNSDQVKRGMGALTEGVFRIGSIAINAAVGIGKLIAQIERLPFAAEQLGETSRLFGIIDEGFARIAGSFTQMDELKKQLADVDAAIENSFLGTPLKYIGTSEEELKKVREGILSEIEKLQTGASKFQRSSIRGGRGGQSDEAVPSEEFEKLSEKYREQIALFGKVGEAAKIRYQLENGLIDGLSLHEQDLLLGYAQQVDALDAVKKAEEERAKAAIARDVDMADMMAAAGELQRNMDDQVLQAGEDLNQRMLDNSMQFLDAELEYARKTLNDRVALEEEAQQRMAEAQERGYDNAAKGLDFLFGKQKAIATAAFLFQKRHEIAQAFIDTRAAVMKTYSKLGYPWGIPAAIAVGALGAANIAQMISASPGLTSTGGAVTGSGGGGLPRADANAGGDGTRGVDARPAINLTINGYASEAMIRELLDGMSELVNGGDVVFMNRNSRQAAELREG